jgi:hypothetical protein
VVTVACVFCRSLTRGYEDIAFQAIKAAITVHILSIFFRCKDKQKSIINRGSKDTVLLCEVCPFCIISFLVFSLFLQLDHQHYKPHIQPGFFFNKF